MARHLGIQVLSIANAVILPFNTTYYSLELERHLARSVRSLAALSTRMLILHIRVEEIASCSSVAVDLTDLKTAITKLQLASQRLDEQKYGVCEAYHRLSSGYSTWPW